MNSPQQLSAMQIARAAGISRQTVDARLDVAAGNFTELPLDWQIEITRRGVKRGFQNGETFLASIPPAPWKSPLSWPEIDRKHRDKAVKLQKALARALQAFERGERGAAIERLGMEDYAREFGYPLRDARHLRRLVHRTTERAGVEQNWQALEIYVDDRAFAVTKAALSDFSHHPQLTGIIESLENRQSPTATDRAFFWDQVFFYFQHQTDALPQSGKRRFKLSLLNYLFQAFPQGALCSSEKSLRRRFDEKYSHWLANGPAVLKDKRGENSGRTGAKLCEPCRKLLIGAAVDLDGNIAQAWRRLQLGKKLCVTCLDNWVYEVRSYKSYVPKTVLRDVRPDIQSAMPWRRGPHFAKLNSPAVRRDWSDTAPGDSTVCDDATPDHATFANIELPLSFDHDSRFGLYIGRMEVLFAVDERTDYPLAFEIILGEPELGDSPQQKAHYNQVHQRLLFLRQHDSVGLPHKQWKLENGPWRNRLNDGEKVNEWETIGFAKFANGLAEATGRRIRHTDPGNPRSKIVERIFGAVWSRMKCQPGYLGNNERLDKREAMADFISRAKAGKEDPRNELLAVSEFRKLLSAELMAFANEPQNGQRLPGVSPMEAWTNGIDGHPGYQAQPLQQLWSDARFLLSTHERLVKVDACNGVTVKIGPTPYYFWGKELEPYQNRTILCRFNFEEPEFLSCCPEIGKPFNVKGQIMPSNSATKEQLAEVGRARASWKRQGKVLFDSLPHPFRFTIARDSQHSEEINSFGSRYEKDLQQHKSGKQNESRKRTQAHAKASEIGAPAELASRFPDRIQLAAEMRREALQEEEPAE